MLSCDDGPLKKFNEKKKARPQFLFDLSLFPEPYFGREDAPVVALTLNPGKSADDKSLHADSQFLKDAWGSLSHSLRPPFLHLMDQHADTPGGKWWRQKWGPVIEEVGIKPVRDSLLCIQYFPYHSEKFGSRSLRVESQTYSFELLRRAIERGAEVVVMRSWSLWSNRVKELLEYKFLHKVNSWQNPTISVKNLGGPQGFETICRRLERGS